MSYAYPLEKTLQDVYNRLEDMEALEERAASIERESRAALKANDKQEGGSHYKGKAIQPWDYIIANDLGYLEGNIVKYVSRWKDKNGVEDLKKAQHYLQKLVETCG